MGRKLSDETKAKISAALRSNTHTKGQKRSPEFRAKMSAIMVGNQNGLGHKKSADSRVQVAETLRGPDYRANGRYCAKIYEGAWGQIPKQDNGRSYSVHHRDGNRQNDDPENLIALTDSEHMELEQALRRGDWALAAEIDALGVSRRAGRDTNL